jgi:hypothetical protein
METHRKRHSIVLIYLIAFFVAKGQNTNRISANDGIWQDYGTTLNAKNYPEFHGRLVNVDWSDIETAPNHWDWSVFDSDVNQHTAGNMPVIILVYTGPNAPDWIYSNGVPKVNATDSAGNVIAYSPYYLDSDYNTYFKRMITNVRQHIQSYSSSTRKLIIALQGCYGSTGDQISYKGTVPSKYQITSTQFDSLFKVYSLYYYNQYKDLNPPIRLLSNPITSDSSQTNWLMNNCPGGWIKCGTFAKGSQINMELDRNEWLYNILNQPQNGQFVMVRSEITGPQLSAGWWVKNHYKEMFAIMCYCIYWGLDWPNETPDFISDPKYDSSFAFFNKYAGQKIPGIATNAMCALKDVLDASDGVRFPASTYGTVSQSNQKRYTNIQDAYSSYGAKLEDVAAAMNNDLNCLTAKGTNDVGWHLLPGNFERYLHQINANATSAGYWNIDGGDNTIMYGRYARGFDISNKKNALYFDLDDNFLRNTPLKGAYPVTIEITYFDSGYGSWKLLYDAIGNNNKASVKVACNNTKKWKKTKVILSDANFGNGSVNNSDFYIQNAADQNVIFSIIELSRAQLDDSGFITTALNAFDTACINSIVLPNSFALHASGLDGSNVKVGPFTNCSFSTSATGNFTESLIINNYSNNTINQTIYVKINTANAVTISGKIPITGGGQKKALVDVKAPIINANPILNAMVSSVSCYNNKDGSINLKPKDGTGPFSYKWTNDVQQFWSATTQDINNLQPANYTVAVNAAYGCSTSKTFAVTQPQTLATSVIQDSSIVCKGGSTTVTVKATGGTLPYTGTGSFPQWAGFTSYTVTDAHGCTDQEGINVSNGLLSAPPKPDGIHGPTSVKSFQLAINFKIVNPDLTNLYIWSVPSDAIIVAGQGTPTIIVNWGKSTGSVTATASNVCGSSIAYSLKVNISNGLTNNTDLGMSAASATTLLSGNEIALMPNPVEDVATLRFFIKTSESYTIEITDIDGKRLLTKKNISLPGSNLEKFDVSNFSAGMYLITLIDQTGERRTLKMIKQ